MLLINSSNPTTVEKQVNNNTWNTIKCHTGQLKISLPVLLHSRSLFILGELPTRSMSSFFTCSYLVNFSRPHSVLLHSPSLFLFSFQLDSLWLKSYLNFSLDLFFLVGFCFFFFPWVVSNLLLPLLHSSSTWLLGHFFFLFIFLCGKLLCFSWRI